jgi:hypothetical protein
MEEWFKENKEIIIKVVLVFLIATVSFGLGYLWRGEIERAPIIIEQRSQSTNAPESTN